MLRGEDVLAVQSRLIELGFDPGKADGVYGPMTATAVAVFQTSQQIESDGIVGTITRRALG
jgi:peptidoglycan hydrolase-like protein with peptidoglycan-binding domain